MIENAILTQHITITAGLLTVAATILGTYIYQKFKKPNIPTEWKAVGVVRKLCIYPLKSGKRIEVEQAECTIRGLMEEEKPYKSLRLRDRSFVVYHEENHEYRNARHYPKMVLIEMRTHNINYLAIRSPEMDSLFFPLPCKSKNKEVVLKHLKNEEILCMDCGNEVAEWVSRYVLGKDSGLRMAYYDGTYKRNQFNTHFKEIINYSNRGLRNESVGLTSDLTAMHIINQASVRDANKKIGNSDVTADDYRPNLVTDGLNLEPYAEDNWEWIKVGDVVMKNVMECVRCVVPTVSSETGVRSKDREPLKTMGKFRMNNGPVKGPVMGIHLEVLQTGIISVGDTIYIGGKSLII